MGVRFNRDKVLLKVTEQYTHGSTWWPELIVQAKRYNDEIVIGREDTNTAFYLHIDQAEALRDFLNEVLGE